MSSQGRTKAHVVSDFRRTQILEAARGVFARRGLHRTTVADIAGAARVAKGTVYLYFRSKDEILQQILVEELARLRDRTVPVIAGPGPVEDRLRAFFLATLVFFDRQRDFIEQCHFDMTPDQRTKARQRVAEVFAAQRAAWRTALRGLPAAGRGPGTAAAALGIVSLAHGLALQRLRGWTSGPAARSAADASALLLHGLGHA